ncbi:hypothetical protein [Neobacillus sp. Marseille-QA0830]
MQIDYQSAKRLEGELIRFQNKEGEWTMGRVAKVRKEGLEIEELGHTSSGAGYGFGFFGGPFFRPPVFFPFFGFAFSPFFF